MRPGKLECTSRLNYRAGISNNFITRGKDRGGKKKYIVSTSAFTKHRQSPLLRAAEKRFHLASRHHAARALIIIRIDLFIAGPTPSIRAFHCRRASAQLMRHQDNVYDTMTRTYIAHVGDEPACLPHGFCLCALYSTMRDQGGADVTWTSLD